MVNKASTDVSLLDNIGVKGRVLSCNVLLKNWSASTKVALSSPMLSQRGPPCCFSSCDSSFYKVRSTIQLLNIYVIPDLIDKWAVSTLLFWAINTGLSPLWQHWQSAVTCTCFILSATAVGVPNSNGCWLLVVHVLNTIWRVYSLRVDSQTRGHKMCKSKGGGDWGLITKVRGLDETGRT